MAFKPIQAAQFQSPQREPRQTLVPPAPVKQAATAQAATAQATIAQPPIAQPPVARNLAAQFEEERDH